MLTTITNYMVNSENMIFLRTKYEFKAKLETFYLNGIWGGTFKKSKFQALTSQVKDNTQNEIQKHNVLDCVAESSFFELKYTGWRGAVTPIFQLKNNCSGVRKHYFTKSKTKIFPLRGARGSKSPPALPGRAPTKMTVFLPFSHYWATIPYRYA